MEISARTMNIFCDLSAQRINIWPLHFGSQALEECELNFRLGCDLDLMEVQHVTLDGIRVFSKRRTISYVGHRFKAVVADDSPRDVHAIRRNKFIVACQVDCRDGVFVSKAAAAAWIRQNGEIPPEKMSCPRDVALLQKLPDVATRYGLPPHLHLGIDVHAESQLCPELLQFFYIALGAMSEMEVCTLVDFDRLKLQDEDLLSKVTRLRYGEV